MPREWTRALLRFSIGLGVALWLAASAAPASAQGMPEELRRTGFWPDMQLSFGGGIALDHSLDANVFGRARIGALYAYEPLILNLGVTGDIGASAEHGVGLELELNHFGGGFLQGGFERVSRDDWMTHFTVGWSLFGVEWQHRIDTHPDNALLFVLRAPIGIWWFLLTRHDNPAPRPAPSAPAPAN